MRGDYVLRMETEELGRIETSEECRHPWHVDHLEKDSTGSQQFERIHVRFRASIKMPFPLRAGSALHKLSVPSTPMLLLEAEFRWCHRVLYGI
ncbi:hypothetical protein QQF64_028326 [Cirrhinus molitorella]|uniref:Uncharacterized protein n=1 Tax=Cirrhinus molitorella TaxID=172907 RepID=A0ABR3N6A2_9TELE